MARQRSKFRVLRVVTAGLMLAGISMRTNAAQVVLPSRAADQTGFVYHPSPADWRELPIYQVITDRFFDGDPANNTANTGGVYNPHSMDSIHGGDFAGLRQHLDYMVDLGFKAIWISPVYLNHHGAYHGYHISDFNRIDPHWGTLEELRAFIDEAHQRGVYVIFDVVFNHMARLHASDAPNYPKYSRTPYPALRWSNPDEQFAPPFNDLDLFHRHGSINNWEDDEQNVLGDLQGLADLRTEDARVRQWLLESHLALIAATDCDGFRIDTAHHVEIDFWQQVLPAIREGAASLGKTNFLMFAEALRGKDEDVSRLTREGAYPSALYYPFYFTLHDVWAKRGATRLITERWRHRDEYGPHARDHLVAFADNHDRARLLNESYLNGDTNRAKAVLALLYASPSIPCVYYGTEQGFSGSKGHRAREPMFAPTRPARPVHFNRQHPLAVWIRQLNQVRERYPALVRGDTEVLMDAPTAGLLVFRRTWETNTVLVVMNNSESALVYPVEETLVDTMTGRWYDGTVPPDSTHLLVPLEGYQSLPVNDTRSEIDATGATGFSESTSTFLPDGLLDEGIRPVASNATTVIYAAYDPLSRLLYVAVSPSPRSHDRFLMLAFTSRAERVDAPWKKDGKVPAYDILISDESESDYTSIRGASLPHWSASRNDGVLEAGIYLPEELGPVVYVRTGTYQTDDLGQEDATRRLPGTADYVELVLDEWIAP
jgi:glycosidase